MHIKPLHTKPLQKKHARQTVIAVRGPLFALSWNRKKGKEGEPAQTPLTIGIE
jgi:hypothetical protein